MTAPPLRQPGEPPPRTDGPVWTGARDRKGQCGRYHAQPDCWALTVSEARRRAWPSTDAAGADHWYPCPYCHARPWCCATGQHTALALPRLAPAERPDWEDELSGEDA